MSTHRVYIKAFQGRAKSPGSLTEEDIAKRECGFRAVLDHLVLLLLPRCAGKGAEVSEPCQITWFSYPQSSWKRSAPFQSRAKSLGFLTRDGAEPFPQKFQDRVRSPDSSTMLGGTPVADWFQSRTKSPGSLI